MQTARRTALMQPLARHRRVTLLLACICFLVLSACDGDMPVAAPLQDDAARLADAGEYLPLQAKCVQVFYDHTLLAGRDQGREDATLVVNLLGHFAEFQVAMGPIEIYRSGDLDRCPANIYLGTFYGNPIPPAFLDDYKKTTSHVLWMGYSLWTLKDDLDALLGVHFGGVEQLDVQHPAADGTPGFFRAVNYRGEAFSKYLAWDPTTTTAVGSFDVSRLTVTDPAKATVLATITHSGTHETIPWAIRAGNRFVIAENPLTYLHESDRYFVFADLLFDLLEAAPRHNGRYAVIRLEDIHPATDVTLLQEAGDFLLQEGVTPHLMLVPVFRDPNKQFKGALPADIAADVTQFTLLESAKLLQYVQTLQDQHEAVILWHGVTHQRGDAPNPFSGITGEDFEFWDAVLQQPVAEDSLDFVLDRLQWGEAILQQAHLPARIWVTPHYQASALDNVLFGQLFPWVMGRMTYVEHQTFGMPTLPEPRAIQFPDQDSSSAAQRRAQFADLVVLEQSAAFVGQIFPYEIYGDSYRQRVIPENLGNVQPAMNTQVTHTRTADEILADAKRNLVLRDVWASAFFHAFLLAHPPAAGGENDLQQLVHGFKKLGYHFVNLEHFVEVHNAPRPLPPVDLTAFRK